MENHTIFRDRNRLILRSDNIGNISPSYGILDNYGNTVAKYYEGGYEYYSAAINTNKVYRQDTAIKLCYSVGMNLVVLNPNKDMSILESYMDLLSLDVFDDSERSFRIKRETLFGIMNKVRSGEIKVSPRIGKYRWTTFMSLEQKRSIVAKNNSRTKSSRMHDLIEKAVDVLTDEFSDIFITPKEVQREVEGFSGELVSLNTIRKYMEVFRDEIDSHNEAVFGTANFNSYMKICSIYNITSAIDAIAELKEKISQRRVAKYASVHYNTVNNLWNETAIQEALDNYNKAFSV